MSELVETLIQEAKSIGRYSFDVEHNPEAGLHKQGFTLWGCSFSTGRTTFYAKNPAIVKKITDELFPLRLEAIAYNGKYDIQCLRQSGWADKYPELLIDPMVGLNLLDDNKKPNQLGLKENIFEIFGHRMMSFQEAFAYGSNSPQFTKYACEDSLWEYKLWERIRPELEHQKLLKYLLNVPALQFFADVETTGILWDLDKAKKLLRDYCKVRDTLEEEIYAELGMLNLDSPKQLATRLFDELGYSTAGLRRTDKGAVSTDADSMEALAHKYPICSKIVKYRTASKMLSTYVVPLSEWAMSSKDQRIHPNFWLVSSTGRTRCDNPNLQNIPAHLDKDFAHLDIRQMFISQPGYKFIVADFSQIELRLMAHFSKDPTFLKAYRDWQCTACGKKGSDIKIQHICPNCGCVENEDILKDKTVKGFWHGLDLHQMTSERVPALHGNRQAGKCVHPNTLITVDNKLIRIGQLSSNRVPGKYEEMTGQIACCPQGTNTLTSFYCDGSKDTYVVFTRKGILACSATHRIGTSEGWVSSQQLKRNQIVDSAGVPKLPESGCKHLHFNPYFEQEKYPAAKPMVTMPLTSEWAYIAGLFIGDGYFATAGQIGFTGGGHRLEDNEWAVRMKDSLEQVGLHVSSISRSTGRTAYTYQIGCRRIAAFFKNQLGLIPKKGVEIVIPEWVWASRQTALAFLGGLFDTDGYISARSDSSRNEEVSICTKSWQLAADVLTLSKACGYVRSRLLISYNTTYKKDYYQVQLDRGLAKEIASKGFIKHPFKYQRITALKNYMLNSVDENKVIKVVNIGQHSLVDVCVSEARHNYTANGLNSHNTANFALIYKAGAHQMNSVYPDFDEEEWEEVIDEYFQTYSGVARFHDYMENVLKTQYETRDILGRKRRIPPFLVKKRDTYKHALNQIINAPVQGSAAGIIQLASTKFRKLMINKGYWLGEVLPVNSVHDETDLEIRDDKVDEVIPIMKECFENIVSLEVPIRIDVGVGRSWKEAK